MWGRNTSAKPKTGCRRERNPVKYSLRNHAVSRNWQEPIVMMVDIDLQKLDAVLRSIGWTRVQLEKSIGEPITSRVRLETKQRIWKDIKAAKRALMLTRPWFPEATVTAIRKT